MVFGCLASSSFWADYAERTQMKQPDWLRTNATDTLYINTSPLIRKHSAISSFRGFCGAFKAYGSQHTEQSSGMWSIHTRDKLEIAGHFVEPYTACVGAWAVRTDCYLWSKPFHSGRACLLLHERLFFTIFRQAGLPCANEIWGSLP